MNVIKYFSRAVASIPASAGISFALSLVAMITIYAVLTLVPEIIHETFSFETREVAQNIYLNQLLPGFGTICAIISGSYLSAKVTAFIYATLLLGSLILVGYAFYLLSKLIKDNVLALVFSCIVFFISLIYTGYLIFGGDTYQSMDIEMNFWFYLTSIIIMIILAVIYVLSVVYIWEERDNYKKVK